MTLPLATGEWRKLSFWVPGAAQTAGSKVTVPIVKEGQTVARKVVESGDRKRKSEWRADVRAAAAAAVDNWATVEIDADDWPCDGPVRVCFDFVRKRPDAHYGTGRNAEVLKSWAYHRRPTQQPDALKLARAVEDALTGVLWTDDARIVEEQLNKWYPDQLGRGRHEVGLAVAVWLI